MRLTAAEAVYISNRLTRYGKRDVTALPIDYGYRYVTQWDGEEPLGGLQVQEFMGNIHIGHMGHSDNDSIKINGEFATRENVIAVLLALFD
ncbi:hypothetical protein UFOVP1616_62 [uncultured Caudovirales phage]|uniref:Uncharacterized protein n=1 Tax=uncultured Caudovirales phage TaxID=2100421 RepID=A0A6J5SYE8_9CAUD|nr:hypothetical protein UFOVP1467_15 [uncultured Caudovirales phage]CAB4219681.1 hypothetical protein UFOVP1616_62 [uncultured Caudovirales phage]